MSVPGRIIETYEQGGLHMVKVDFGGVSRKVCLDHIPQAQVGQYCLIYVGFKVSVWNEDEVLETLNVLKQIGSIEEEFEKSE